MFSSPSFGERSDIVINEIHFHPPGKRPLEFIELFNSANSPVDVSNWSLEGFRFPASSLLQPNDFCVIAADPEAFAREYGFKALGPLSGRLKHSGEKIRLKDSSGRVRDEVDFRVGFPWPSGASGTGSSLEKVHPVLPSSDASSWRSSGFPLRTEADSGSVLIPAGDSKWKWKKGDAEPSQPQDAWRQLAFMENQSWVPCKTSIGYGDGDDATVLGDMQGHYTSIFLRRTFVWKPSEARQPLHLRIRVDDGCVLWLNGHQIVRKYVPDGELRFSDTALNHEAEAVFEEVSIPGAEQWLQAGDNVLAVHVLNSAKDSSDLSFDLELRAGGRAQVPARPTPGKINSVYSQLRPPAVRTVNHEPATPRTGQPVTVTARVFPADSRVDLQLQNVKPGAYLRKSDEAFLTTWSTIQMRDDGVEGDSIAGDGVFSAVVPGEFQQHRHLMRYRVRVTARDQSVALAPDLDDSCPNFSWFTFDGIPEWKGASQPGKTPEKTFSAEFMRTLPALYLLADRGDVASSQWNPAFHRRPFWGTIFYEGKVYDHVRFHNRGTGSAYISGKNKWGIQFARGHRWTPTDNSGRPYAVPWDSLNLNPGLSTPYIPIHCGITGLDEALSFRAFQLAGVPAAHTHWMQFRVVATQAESSPANQYEGDLWGVYLCVRDMDGDWLKELGLPEGNVYSLQSGRKNLAKGMPADNSDWNGFINAVRTDHGEAWWRSNLNLPSYFGFHAINRLMANVDIRPDGNAGYYHAPDGRWSPVPWDLDMMFVPRHHQPGHIDAVRCLNYTAIRREYQNRAREILDLFCSDLTPSGGQIGQLVSELARVIQPTGFSVDWSELDECVWNWRPNNNQKGSFFVNPATASHFGGPWNRSLATKDFGGFCRYVLDFCTDSRPGRGYAPNDGNALGYGFGYLAHEANDDGVPQRPTIQFSGAPARNASDLRFEVSPFSSPVGALYAGVQWRLAEIGSPDKSGASGSNFFKYELEATWQSPELQQPVRTLTLPPGTVSAGRIYRVRARYKDNAGRWSRWSEADQFILGK